jgi:hypothetical protein
LSIAQAARRFRGQYAYFLPTAFKLELLRANASKCH